MNTVNLENGGTSESNVCLKYI